MRPVHDKSSPLLEQTGKMSEHNGAKEKDAISNHQMNIIGPITSGDNNFVSSTAC